MVFRYFTKLNDLQALCKYFDLNGDGMISCEEFMKGLQDDLNERRAALVERAWNCLDLNGSGEITADDVMHLYDVSSHKDLLEGTKTKEEIIGEFLDNFDGPRGNNDGVITKGEFGG